MEFIFGAIIGFIIFAFFNYNKKLSNKTSLTSDSTTKASFLFWLREAKNKGIFSLSELITQLEYEEETQNKPIDTSNVVSNTSNIVIVPRPNINNIDTKSTQITNLPPIYNNEISESTNNISTSSSKPHSDISNATILLYVGSFLIVFALFVLVALNWQNFPNILKSFLISFTALGFLGTGLIFYTKDKYKHAGEVFLYTSSILIALCGIGYWNFGLNSIFDNNFSLYWAIYSLGLLIFNLILLYTLKIQNLFYIILAIVFSLSLSSSFALTSDYKFRVVIFSILNLLTYYFSTFIKQNREITRVIFASVNEILNVLIILTILANLNDFTTINYKLIGIIALFIPTTFEIIFYCINKNKHSLLCAIYSFPFKLLLSLLILKVSVEIGISTFVSMLVFMFAYEVISIYFKKSFEILKNPFKYVSWLTIICISISLIFPHEILQVLEITPLFNGVVVVVLSILLLVPEILSKNYVTLSWLLPYLLFTLIQIFFVITRVYNYLAPLCVVNVFILVCTGIQFIFKYKFIKIHNLLFGTIICAGLYSGIICILAGDIWNICITYLMLTGIAILIGYIYKILNLRYLIIFLNFIWYLAFIYILQSKMLFQITSPEIIGIFFLIPTFCYLFSADILNVFHKNNTPEVIGGFIFALITFILCLYNVGYILIYLGLLLIYAVYLYFRTNYEKELSYGIFILLESILILGLYFYNVDHWLIFTLSILLSLSLNILNYLFGYLSPSASTIFLQKTKSLKNFSNLSFLFSLISLCIIGVLILSSTLKEVNGYFIICCILLSFSFEIIRAKERWYLTGIPIVFIFWYLDFVYSLNLQLFVIPLVVYLLFVSFTFYLRSGILNNQLSASFDVNTQYLSYGFNLEYSSYLIEIISLLIASIYESETLSITFGIILMIFCSILLFWGMYRKKIIFIVTSIVFIMIELLIRLYSLLVAIPWWIYLGVMGLVMVSFAVYLLSKNNPIKE